MKVINLNKFKTSQQVEIDGAIYQINGVSVQMYLNDTDLAKLDTLPSDAAYMKERIETVIKVLRKLSNIPEEILYQLELKALITLLQISQGVDVEAEGEAEVLPNA